jgi:hypothetical protein
MTPAKSLRILLSPEGTSTTLTIQQLLNFNFNFIFLNTAIFAYCFYWHFQRCYYKLELYLSSLLLQRFREFGMESHEAESPGYIYNQIIMAQREADRLIEEWV